MINIGDVFDRLTIIGETTPIKTKSNSFIRVYVCKCKCGKIKNVREHNLIYGHTKSCGCLQRETLMKRNFSHKKSKTRLYDIYQGMKKRCKNKNATEFKAYGGRGIIVCKEWEDSFMAFYKWAMANGYTDTLTIDRIDNKGNYCPENCRWVSYKQQANNRANNLKFELSNKTYSLQELAEKHGLSYSCLWQRLKKGWSLKDALDRPQRITKSKRST